jgi:glycosyltransferase involved in cell wall biosynthesis
MDVLGGLAAMFSALPFVVSERCSAPMYPGTWKHWLRIHVGQRAATIVANSASGAMYWKPWASRIEVVRNGFSSSLIKEASAADPAIFGFPSSSKLILFAGRLSSQKNIHVLIEALDEVLTKKEDCVALVFGEGELRQTIQSHLTMLWSRDRIRLPGYTNQLSNWMRRSSVFVSISLYEGHPNVILEAMAIGCPLVVSDIPEHREILDDARAVFCSPHSAIEVAAAISKILEDPVSASTQAGLAREAVMDWSVHEAARRYWKIYEGVLSREQPSTLRTRLSSLLKM